MRVLRLPAALAVAAVLAAGAAGCAATIEGSGSPAQGLATGGPTPTVSPTGSSSPTATASPSPTPRPTPTISQITVRRKLLCVLEQASIRTINSQFNSSKDRNTQIRVLRTGATSISGHLTRSQLSANDRVRRSGQSVLSQLNSLIRAAEAGRTPSTDPYNRATRAFQQVCGSL
jgi:hypothetical protein